ncbi:DUF1266 domain-containing protein [Microbulbifer sp. TRSA002]|uniref:DUF1266 domain-containing protein n=1 Tax=Microbulbifer sp. TRSA002 TaxID=3243382 RepID=UPI00403A7AB9
MKWLTNLTPEQEYFLNPDALSQTQLWILGLMGQICEMNELRHDVFHNLGTSEQSRQNIAHMMKRDWGIESREDCLSMLEWLRTEGHNAGYMPQQKYFEGLSEAAIDAYIEAHDHDTDEQIRLKLVKAYRHTLQVGGIGAWDYARFITVSRWCTSLELLSEEEAWEKMLDIAQRAQKSFDSWYSYGLSYIAGRQYWRKTLSEDFAKKSTEVIKGLTGSPHSPWNSLPWDLNLNPF